MFYDAVKNDHGPARCGYDQYAVVQEVFAMTRPTA